MVEKESKIHWLISSFLALVLSGVGNFLISEGLRYPYDLKLLVSIGHLSFLISMSLFNMFYLRYREGFFPEISLNAIYSKHTGFIPGFFFGVNCGILLFLGQFSLILGWYYDPEGKSLNFFMLAVIPLATAFAAFLVFNEKLKSSQLLGMLISIAGISILGLDKISGGSWVSYVVGLNSIILFTLRNLNSRAMQTSGVSILAGAMLTSAVEVACGTVLLIFLVSLQEFEVLFSWDWLFQKCCIGVIFVAYGQYFTTRAIMSGITAISVTIINAQGIIFIFLDLIFYGNFPELISLIAISVILLGIVVLVIGETVVGPDESRKGYEQLGD